MAKFKIDFKVDDCIGCGTCVACCPDNWEMDGDKAKAKKIDLDDAGCNQEAADSCPASCIHIEKAK